MVLRNPQHPYTQRLLASVPQLPAEGRPKVAQLAPASVDLAPPFEERWLWGLAV
ncbi:ABC transporter ATP-binding protein [Pseudomonas sp. A6]|uniref:ABC transporter ATP-binding protein n=1 Tax=Pseudomonas sp. A6 TaxID=410021 RepID=UPI004024EF6D